MNKPVDETIRQILSNMDELRSRLRAPERKEFLCTVDAFKLVELARAADQYLDLGGPMARRELIDALDALMPDPPWPRRK